MAVIAVVDYDMGNLHSVCKALEKAGATPKVTSSPKDLQKAMAIVLPGVGAFDPAMQNLRSRNLVEPIKNIIADGKPFLGICLGMQILFESSEEGSEKGLGIIKGKVKRFRRSSDIRIPHMGWNQLEITQPMSLLWEHLPPSPWVYFVHSFYVEPVEQKINAATVTHGSQTVTAAIAYDNVTAVQFHPEKSSNVGLQILSNFVSQVREKIAV
ncbi:MAG: imidazole glycerol phosphate synthase subunit HisH [Richelia sp. RM2_1_2]|nr:imidazole glycerol phosphate synthase subunit HisH [Richelia sp. SM2_1_7]NJM23092.1 imidazole glycerol phosphate synthase subunit HisH [Richelia sp. SM1_7_0]NJN10636.1 imidazole glycerol phosphate synthase subunit HisH [Richelia sp. RM1_1_1]NJO27873.1 imidazole glycerol phosphate synthase subunit HisH [Richelia sp. SL_2_1]NJO61200.1 imidazole glycerol phosphate synthase subunit HisH [Richelia sp. RM2_1_2]